MKHIVYFSFPLFLTILHPIGSLIFFDPFPFVTFSCVSFFLFPFLYLPFFISFVKFRLFLPRFSGFYFSLSLSPLYASFYLARFLSFFLFLVRLPENKQLANAHSATRNDPTCTSNFASNALLPKQTHTANLGEMFVTLKRKFKFALSYWVDRSKSISCNATQRVSFYCFEQCS